MNKSANLFLVGLIFMASGALFALSSLIGKDFSLTYTIIGTSLMINGFVLYKTARNNNGK